MEPADHSRRRGGSDLPEALDGRFGDLTGVRVLHAGCGDGSLTASLAARGALVTGVDVDAEALAVARGRGSDAVFVSGDPGALPPEIRRGRFQLVVAGLRDIVDVRAWALGLAAALQPGGSLLVYGEHPGLARDYFASDVVRVGELVTAIASVPDLRLVSLDELPTSYQAVERNPRVPGELVLVAEKAPIAPA